VSSGLSSPVFFTGGFTSQCSFSDHRGDKEAEATAGLFCQGFLSSPRPPDSHRPCPQRARLSLWHHPAGYPHPPGWRPERFTTVKNVVLTHSQYWTPGLLPPTDPLLNQAPLCPAPMTNSTLDLVGAWTGPSCPIAPFPFPLQPAQRCGREGWCLAAPGRKPWSSSLACSTGHRAGIAGQTGGINIGGQTATGGRKP
jgi:hypothetical protein